MPTVSGYANGEPIEAVDINQYFLRGNRNALINGDMRIAQRGATLTIADGSYGFDQWIALASGASGVGSSGQNTAWLQEADANLNGSQWMRLTLSGANNLKFGCAQILENRNLTGVRSGTVTLSFKAKATSNITDVRAAIVGWAGTADSVTRDLITTAGTPWLASPPTLATNWSYLNTPTNLGVTTNTNTFRITANVTGNPNNLAVFIWVNSTVATAGSDFLYISDVQLEPGAIATPFERRHMQDQLADCQRYYWRLSGNTSNFTGFLCGGATGGTGPAGRRLMCTNPVTMRTSPSLNYGGAFQYGAGNGVYSAVTALGFNSSSNIFTSTDVNSATAITVNTFVHGIINGSAATDFFEASAEL